MLVIACNTASAAVLRDARERYDVPVVEVIRPAVRRAVAATRNGHVGVICTVGHEDLPGLRGRLRRRAADRGHHAGLPAVRRVRRGRRHRRPGAAQRCAHEYLDPVAGAGVDTLILGCTHYPLLTGVISYVMGDGVTLVSSAEETAKDVYRTLVAEGLERPTGLPEPEHRFLTTGDPQPVPRTSSRRFLGPEVGGVEQVA